MEYFAYIIGFVVWCAVGILSLRVSKSGDVLLMIAHDKPKTALFLFVGCIVFWPVHIQFMLVFAYVYEKLFEQ
jgi:hypothetical protein